MANVEENTELNVEETRESGQEDAVNRKKRFRWDKDNKVENLIRCLANYKSQLEFQNSDFEADRVKQYECVRVALANIYAADTTLFGPPSVVSSPLFSLNDESLDVEAKREKQRLLKQRQEERNQIKKGYQRVQEKLKEIRQNFSTAVTTGRRSGSGKVVLDFYDELVQIWGGSPSTQPLSCGTSTQQINNTATAIIVPDKSNEGSDNDLANSFEHTLPMHTIHDDVEINSIKPKGTGDKDGGLSDCKKRKAENVIPKLIDNKRKHMERQLSAAKRDELLLKESKEDSQFKKDMTEAIRQSNKTFENSMQQMSSSIVQVAQSLTQSMEIMGRAIMQQNSPNNMPYPHHYPLHVPVYNNHGIQQVSNSESRDVEGGATGDWTYQTL